MPELRVAELADATGGTLLRGDREARVTSYEIDTRRLRPGAAFFALKGERTDGHAYLDRAAGAGAVVAIVEREPEGDGDAPAALIRVDDAVEAMYRAASWTRRKMSATRWIALTGSNGKTTTKELIADGLAARHRVHRTPGNFNNQLGAPLSLLSCPIDAEFAVIELGMNHAGEIARLAGMTDPDFALVTNVRAAHLAFFGSLDDIAAAKGEMFAVLRDDATAVINVDDAHVRVQAARHVGPQVTFGQRAGADLRLEELQSSFLPGTSFAFRYRDRVRRVQLRLGGAHAAFNALAALAVVVATGGDPDTALERMQRVEAGPGRGKVHRIEREMVVVDDSYNCSPAALASILETLRSSSCSGRKVLVLGDMLELGRVEGALHREAGKRAAAAGVQLLVAVGPLSRSAVETARRAGVAEVHHHADSVKAAESIAEFLKDGDLIVVKGSRAMRMERIVHALVPRDREAA